MFKTPKKITLIFMKLNTTDDSHIRLKMEINGGVSRSLG
jgi:hypothetical protein